MVETQIAQVFNGVQSLITYNDPEHVKHVRETNTWHEIHMLEHIAKTKRDGIIIDIGANVGQHSVFFATHCTTGSVYSFEPNPDSFKCLVKNIVDNRLTNITPIMAAIGDFGILKVVKSGRSGTASISERGDGEDVVVVPLFDYGKVDLIKIDVEGMEDEVLAKCLKIVEKYKPEIYIETFNKLERITDCLSVFGYTMKGRFNNAPTYWFTV